MRNNYSRMDVVNRKNGITNWILKGFPTKGETALANKAVSCCTNIVCC